MTRPRKVLAVLALAVPALGGLVLALARIQGSEEEIKAAFLYKFTHFVEWEDGSFRNAAAPYVIGVLGKDPFGKALDETLADKKVNGRGFSIVRAAAPEALKGCHMVYVSPSEKGNRAELLQALNGANLLVVGDSEGFAAAGAAINFVLEDRKVRLEINPAAAGRARLKVSSKLLQLCKIVQDKAGKP